MNIFIIIGIVIFVIYLCLHIKLLVKTNNDYEILQSNNPSKENFEKILLEKSVSVFTNISSNWNINLKDDNLKTDLEKYLDYYATPLSVNRSINIDNNKNNYKTNLIIQKKNRHLILQLMGKRKYILFNPLQKKNLYFKKSKSTIDYWNLNIKKYPLVNDAKFIEVIIHENQMIYIPKNWIYCYKNLENSITVSYNSETLLSSLF